MRRLLLLFLILLSFQIFASSKYVEIIPETSDRIETMYMPSVIIDVDARILEIDNQFDYYTMEIIDDTGNVEITASIMPTLITPICIDLTGLSAGIYTIHLYNSSTSLIGKFTLN